MNEELSRAQDEKPGLAPYAWALAAYLLCAFSIPAFGPYLGGFFAGALAGFKTVRAPKDMITALVPAALGAAAFAWWADAQAGPDATEAVLTATRIMQLIAVQSVFLAAVAAALGAAAGYQTRSGAKS